MFILEISTEKKYKVEISLVEDTEYKLLNEDRYFFDWRTEKTFEVYKLYIDGTNNILGLVSIERIPNEWRIHIRLLTVSKENKGKNKKFENIIGNLLAFVSKIAVKEYAEFACVSLKPKSQIAYHYMDKYKMNLTGKTLSIEVPEILDLIKFYDNE